jgi:hypothetical protein
MSELNYFELLNKIDVSDKIEKKDNLSYLSWSFAWGETKKHHPGAKYDILKNEKGLPYFYDENTGYMVFTWVEINGIRHDMWLAVLDFRNKTMKNKPYTYKGKKWNKKEKKYEYYDITVEAATMFDINKALMRCLTKNLAMHGLGLYIYAGEDLPEKNDEFIGLKTEQKAEINKKDKAIVDYLLKTAKYNSLDEVKFSEYDIFMNNIKICEQKKAEKEKTTTDKQKKSGEQLQEEMQDKLGQILLYVAERNDGGLTEGDILKIHSSFKGRDGKTIQGVDCISELTGKRLSATYGNVCKAYPDVSALIKEEYENKMKEKKGA